MLKIIVILLVGYLLWLAVCYSRWKFPGKSYPPEGFQKENPQQKSDIVGKSKFDLSHSKPDAATAFEIEKGKKKEDIFAALNKKMLPQEKLDEIFSEAVSGENLELMDLEFFLDYEDGEELEEEENAQVRDWATGLHFEALSHVVKTVNDNSRASPQMRQAAGNTLLEIRKTDMFEQLVSAKPNRKEIISQLIEESLAAFHLKMEMASEREENFETVPDSFDIRDYL